jgi:hypothetical protein
MAETVFVRGIAAGGPNASMPPNAGKVGRSGSA